ncbi:hypothetical protein [Microbacterium sp. BK668]|uniref:hypothetical protein n=1 Tax=Microbacterium sp. BK668 TaxID=2512118 RepID=UPI00105E00DD|nr:hypothetical protein [Microbacterium sp. BK668]TDN93075.1 hypothetical protein EV279_2618 [Microbacterium sp. BK668]
MPAVTVLETASARQRPRSSADRALARPGQAHALLSLQPLVGNAAVTSLLEGDAPRARAQRLVEGAGMPPVAPTPADPATHPGLRAVRASVKSAAARAAQHPSPKAAVATAEKAVEPAPDEAEAQAKKERAETIGSAPTPGFDKAAFIAAVNEAIAKQSPKTLEDAATFASSGKAESVGAEVKGRVTQSKAASTGPLSEATAQPPDTSRATVTPGTPLPAAPPTPAPALGAARAAPTPAPKEQTDLAHGPAQVDQQLSESGVSEEQLRNSNEPEFTDALAAKGEAAQHAATAPAALREREAGVIAAAQQDAAATGAGGAAALASGRAAGLNQLLGGQQQAKGAAEGKHAQVNADLRAIFDKTKTDVEAILSSIDTTVEADFAKGEAAARAAFKQFHEREMDAFKEREYGWNLAAWTKDLLFGPPPAAQKVFEKSRTFYQNEMTKVISSIADTVGRKLTEAKTRIATGKEQMAAHIRGLDPALRAEANKAAQAFSGQFDQLEHSVDEKSQAVVEDLAAKYVAAKGEVDAEITKMQEESKGLVGRAVAAVGGVITTIKNLAAMLTQVLARAAAAVDKIIKDPIGFLGNFVNAVKGGIQQFGANIATHLKSGLQSWLFGALAEGGIELPEKFDFKGVLQLILSILGLTWAKVRARIAAKLPPGALEAVEKGFTVVKTIMTVGISGIWQLLLEKLGDIKEMVLTQVKEMVSIEIIKAGIVWLISMLNPASAFVKACKMIYDVVMFFVEKAAQIKEFVDSILDSVESIAGGGVGAVAGYIEKTLGRMVPVIIGFMASLLGLGGISGKIRAILEKIQEPVGKAIDWVVGKAVAFGKKALTLGKKLLAKAKDLGKKAIGKIKKKLGIKEKTPEQIEADKKKRLDKGVAAGVKVVNALVGKPVIMAAIPPLLTSIRAFYRMQELKPVLDGGKVAIYGKVNPDTQKPTLLKPEKPDAYAEQHVGNIAPHTSQPKRGPNLWSEHVIPGSYVGFVLIALTGKPLPDSDYNAMTTILTYNSARKGKDFGHGGASPLQSVDAKLTKRMLGRARGSQPASGVPAQSTASKDNVLRTFDLMSKGAVERTVRAVAADWAAHKATRISTQGGELPQKPDEAAIRTAVAQQTAKINEIFAREGIR